MGRGKSLEPLPGFCLPKFVSLGPGKARQDV